jgi:hypothetical protein
MRAGNPTPRSAIEQVLTSRNLIQGLRGSAGVGKTATLESVRHGAEQIGCTLESSLLPPAPHQLRDAGSLPTPCRASSPVPNNRETIPAAVTCTWWMSICARKSSSSGGAFARRKHDAQRGPDSLRELRRRWQTDHPSALRCVLPPDLAGSASQPGFREFDLHHGLQKLLGGAGTDVLDQRLVVEGYLSIEGKPGAHFLQQIDHLLGINIEEVEMLIDREP